MFRDSTGFTIAPVRAIFFALLLVNLLYLGWAEWIDVPAAPPARSSIAGLPRLTLAREVPAGKRAVSPAKMALEAPPPQCVSVGPFDDPVIAAKAVTVLRTKSLAPQQRTAEAPALPRFWVYLDGFKTDAGEMRVLHRLERAGIDDAEAMPADAGGRKISLGLFSDRARAVRRAKVVQAVGFQTAMTKRMLPGTVYWLDLTLPGGSAAVPLQDVSELEPAGARSAITVQSCPSPSSPAATPVQQTSAPAMSPVTPPAASPEANSSPVQAAALPLCKPGGGGPVPCILKKATTHPSVL